MNKNLIILSLGRVSQMIVMFLTFRVLSHVLSVQDMGGYYFLLSISAGFGLLFANPIGMYAARMAHLWKEHQVFIRNIKRIVLALAVGSIATIAIVLLFKEKIASPNNLWTLFIPTLIFYVFSTTMNGTIVPMLNLFGYLNYFTICTVLTNVFGLALSYVMVKWITAEPLYWLLGQGISFFIFGITALFLLARIMKEKENVLPQNPLDRIKRVSKFASPIIVTNLAVWSFGQSFRFIFKENIEAVTLGELTFGLGLASSLAVAVEYLFQQIYYPVFYSSLESNVENRGAAWNNLFNKLAPSFLSLTFFMIGLSPFILRVLADQKFKNAVYYFAFGAIVELFRMMGNIFNLATHSEMKTHRAILPYLSGGAVALFGVIVISKNPQFVAFTPLCLVAGQLIAVVMLHRSISKLFNLEISWRSLLKSILQSSLFLCALFFQKGSDRLIISVLICGVFGLYWLYLFFNNFRNSNQVEAL